jgi:hypothetical protein
MLGMRLSACGALPEDESAQARRRTAADAQRAFPAKLANLWIEASHPGSQLRCALAPLSGWPATSAGPGYRRAQA